jgi:hypothetical protein
MDAVHRESIRQQTTPEGGDATLASAGSQASTREGLDR